MNKQEIRKQMQELLRSQILSLPVLSEGVAQGILESDAYKKAEVVLAYMSLPDEVDLSNVIDHACNNNKKVFVPRVDRNSSYMDFYEYDEASIEEGSFGIEEPSEKGTIFNLEKTDFPSETSILILVPGRAFTKTGNRLGRGKGYYDTYLSRLKKSAYKNICMAGVCFESQILEELPVESHDFTMDMIFS